MATQVQLRGGTTSEHSTFTGAVREVTVDTTKDTVVVHDGSTAGGIPLAKEASVLPLAGGTMTGDVSLGDNVKAKFGASDDLQIYHNGNNSFIEDAGTGSLYVRASSDFRVQSYSDNKEMIRATADGAANLYHNGSNKLATTSTGIDVTGTVNGLEINTTATSNLGLGTGAVDAITTGDYNVGVGDYALTSNTTGYQNTATGYAALGANTTGIYNTASGYQALYSNTTGVDNVAVGYRALKSTGGGVDGSYNTAVGTSALEANTEGTFNVAMGRRALYFNTTGDYNTGIGYLAEYNNTTGVYNSGFGHGSLLGVTTGSNNTGLGYNAGANLTTGSNNIIIGQLVNAPSATASNQLNIGNTIYGDTSTGNVGIGTSSPSVPLDVYGAIETGLQIKSSAVSNHIQMFVTNSGGGNQTSLKRRFHSMFFGTDADPGLVEFNNAGDISLEGNLVIGTSGKGIDFSAATPDGTGSTGSEVLDDYEEGAWTPTWTAGASDATYTIQVGTYTKIGNKVHVQGYMTISSLGTMSGDLTLGGLPFTSVSTTNVHSALHVGYGAGLAITAGTNLSGNVGFGSTNASMRVWGSTAGTSKFTTANLSANGAIIFSMDYISA